MAASVEESRDDKSKELSKEDIVYKLPKPLNFNLDYHKKDTLCIQSSFNIGEDSFQVNTRKNTDKFFINQFGGNAETDLKLADESATCTERRAVEFELKGRKNLHIDEIFNPKVDVIASKNKENREYG